MAESLLNLKVRAVFSISFCVLESKYIHAGSDLLLLIITICLSVILVDKSLARCACYSLFTFND